MVTPGRHRRRAQAVLEGALGDGQFAARVHPLELLLHPLDGDGAVAFGACDADRVGEVEFALHIVVADRFQEFGDQRAVEAHHAGIDEVDRFFRRIGVLALDDLLELVTGHDQPAVGRRIARPKAQHADGGHRPTAGLHQPVQALRRQQR
jgi:hypothetical protein